MTREEARSMRPGMTYYTASWHGAVGVVMLGDASDPYTKMRLRLFHDYDTDWPKARFLTRQEAEECIQLERLKQELTK